MSVNNLFNSVVPDKNKRYKLGKKHHTFNSLYVGSWKLHEHEGNLFLNNLVNTKCVSLTKSKTYNYINSSNTIKPYVLADDFDGVSPGYAVELSTLTPQPVGQHSMKLPAGTYAIYGDVALMIINMGYLAYLGTGIWDSTNNELYGEASQSNISNSTFYFLFNISVVVSFKKDTNIDLAIFCGNVEGSDSEPEPDIDDYAIINPIQFQDAYSPFTGAISPNNDTQSQYISDGSGTLPYSKGNPNPKAYPYFKTSTNLTAIRLK